MVDWAEAENRAARAKVSRRSSFRSSDTDGTLASERDLKSAVIENPYSAGSMETATKRVRDPIESLYSQGKLDNAQLKAAHILRGAVEKMGTRISSIDPERVRVDGGKKGDPALFMLSGAETLRRVQRAVEGELGKEGWAIVRRVAAYGEGLTVVAKDYAVCENDLKNGGISREAKAYASRALQRGLEHAAMALGV